MALTVRRLDPIPGDLTVYRPPEGQIYDPTPLRVANAPTGINSSTPFEVRGPRPRFITPTSNNNPFEGIGNVFNTIGRGINDVFIQPTVEFGTRAGNTVALPFVAGAAAITGQNRDPNIQNALYEMLQRSFVTPDIAGGRANPAEFTSRFAQTGLEGATYVAPFGRVAQGTGLLTRAGVQGGLNAGLGAAQNALDQLNNTGQVNAGEVAKSALLGGALGAAAPVAGATGRAVTRRVNEINAQSPRASEAGFFGRRQPEVRPINVSDQSVPRNVPVNQLRLSDRLSEIRSQLQRLPDDKSVRSMEFNARKTYADRVRRVNQIGRTDLLPQIRQLYENSISDIQQIIAARKQLAAEADAIKVNPLYQAARPLPKEVSSTRVRDSQMAAQKPTVTEKNPYSPSGRPLTNDARLLDVKIKNVKNPQRKAELIAERNAKKTAVSQTTKPNIVQPEKVSYRFSTGERYELHDPTGNEMSARVTIKTHKKTGKKTIEREVLDDNGEWQLVDMSDYNKIKERYAADGVEFNGDVDMVRRIANYGEENGALNFSKPKIASKTAVPTRTAQEEINEIYKRANTTRNGKLTITEEKRIAALAAMSGKPTVQMRGTGKSPNALDRAWRSVAGVLEKNGTGGKAINRGIQNARDFSEKRTANVVADLEDAGLKKVSKADFETIVDHIEAGKVNNLPTNLQPLANQIVKSLKQVHDLATTEGKMNIGDRGATYFPHWFKDSDKNMVGLVQRNFNQRFSNLERKREVEGGGYEKSQESLVRYIQSAIDRIGRSKEFGQTDDKLMAMLEVANREGYDVNQLARYAKVGLGDVDNDTAGHRASDIIRQINAITSLQKSAVANIGQTVNTATVAGLRNTAKGFIKYVSDKEARDWARRTGVYGDHILGNIQKQYAGIGGAEYGTGFINAVKRHVLVPGMQAVEQFNRANGVLAGREYGKYLLKQAAKGNRTAIRQLDEFFPGVKPGQKVTQEQLTNAARELVKRTQFKVDPVDLPKWTAGPVGKVIFQFRSFGYKQTQFLARQVIGEALHGNFKPMARFLALGVPVGYGISEARNFISGKDVGTAESDDGTQRQKTPQERAIEGFSQVGGGGLLQSEGQNIMNNIQYNKPEDRPKEVGIGLLGPTATNINRAAEAAGDALNGQYRNGAIFLASKVPVVGPYVSSAVKKSMKGNTEDVTTMSPSELSSYQKKTYAKFRGGLSDSDKQLFDVANNSDASRIAVKNGRYTQDQLDDMDTRFNREKFKAGLPIKYINSIKDEDFDKMSPELQGMVLEASLVGKKRFEENANLDTTAKAVLDIAFQNKWDNVGDIKQTNKLALSYLNAQKKLIDASDDQGKQFDAVKSFWSGAVKDQYPDRVKNMYANGINDIKRLLEGFTVGGKTYSVSKDDLDQAIDLDNRLVKTGLIDKPKFSNKTRRLYGYGDAPDNQFGSAPDSSSRDSRGRGGSSRTASFDPTDFEVKRNSVSVNLKAPAARGRTVNYRSTRGKVGKPKVSLKKAKA